MLEELLTIEPVRQFLLGGGIYSQLREQITGPFNIPEGRMDELLDLADAVINQQVTVEQMPGLIAQAFGVSEDVAKQVAVQLVGYRLLPLENYVPGIQKGLKAIGGNAAEFPKERIEKDRAVTELIVARVSEKYGVKLPDYLNKRLVMFAKTYLEKERAVEPTIELMKRPTNIGGLELSEEAARNILKELETERAQFTSPFEGEVDESVTVGADLVSTLEDAVVEPEPEFRISPSGISPKTVQLTEEDLDKITADELRAMAWALQDDTREPDAGTVITEAELLAWARRLQEPVISEVGSRLALRSSDGSEGGRSEVVGAGSVTGPEIGEEHSEHELLPAIVPTTALAKEVPVVSGDMIEEHEKADVREGAKRAERLVRAVPVDKTASQAQVNALLQVIVPIFKKKRIAQTTFKEIAQGHVKGLREPLRTQELLQEKYGFEAQDVKTIMQTLEDARKIAQGEHTPLSDRGVAEVGSRKSEVGTEEMSILDKRFAAITKTVPEMPLEPVAPSARVSAARTKGEELEEQKKSVSKEKIAAAEEASKPKPAKAKLSVQSAPPKKGTMTDVTFVKTLAGPVDELRTMTPVEFRRLSSSPREAVQKIQDKLDLLESTSYEERIKGVEAWRVSPMSRLYLAMTQQALLEGISLAEIASRRRNAGEESLSPTEIKAIVSLNKAIKF